MAALDVEDLDPVAKFALVALAARSGRYSLTARVSYTRLAKDLGDVDRRTAIRAVQRLLDRKLVTVDKRPGGTNVFHMGVSPETPPGVSPETDGGVTGDTPCPGQGCHPRHPKDVGEKQGEAGAGSSAPVAGDKPVNVAAARLNEIMVRHGIPHLDGEDPGGT
jgi:hypothetical protein